MAFIGYEKDYDEYKEKENISDNGETTEDGNQIYMNTEPISDEMIQQLCRVRTRNDPYTVYMQNDISFYDTFYFEDEKNDPAYNELLSEVRQIRRICRDYSEYLYMLYIRDQYFEYLREKYGQFFDVYMYYGIIPDWQPPMPIFVNTNMDSLETVMSGVLEVNDFDDDYIKDITTKYYEELPNKDMRVVSDVETRHNVLRHITDDGKYNKSAIRTVGGVNSKIGSVSINDLDELQSMFRGWYQEEQVQEDEDCTEFFSNTPTKIRERYYSEDAVDMRGEFSEILEKGYCDDITDYNPNEMVIDSTTKMPMTRAEQRKREFIRMMGNAGWSTVKLMREMNVGSSYEIRLLEEKNRRRKLSKKKAKSLMRDVMGTNFDDVSTCSSIEELNDILFDD